MVAFATIFVDRLSHHHQQRTYRKIWFMLPALSGSVAVVGLSVLIVFYLVELETERWENKMPLQRLFLISGPCWTFEFSCTKSFISQLMGPVFQGEDTWSALVATNWHAIAGQGESVRLRVPYWQSLCQWATRARKPPRQSETPWVYPQDSSHSKWYEH